MGDSQDEWWAEPDEVLRHDRSGDLYHVRSRLSDVDTGERLYELADDTHTTRTFDLEEDVIACYSKTGVLVRDGKPAQRIDGRLYDDEYWVEADADSEVTDGIVHGGSTETDDEEGDDA